MKKKNNNLTIGIVLLVIAVLLYLFSGLTYWLAIAVATVGLIFIILSFITNEKGKTTDKQKIDKQIIDKQKFCTKCGKELFPNSKFCVICGAETKESTKESTRVKNFCFVRNLIIYISLACLIIYILFISF